MQTLAMASSRLFFLFSSIFIHLVALTIAQQDGPLYHICSTKEGNFTTNSTYQTNLNHLLSSSFNTKIDYGFYNASYGKNRDKVNAMALCRGDVKPDSCRSCINGSTLELTKLCPNQKEAIIWYDNCLLRYSDRFFFGLMEFGPWFWMYNINNVSDANTFNQAVGTLLDGLKKEAASGDSRRKFATGNANTSNSQTIYALVQCTPDLSKQQCSDCLNNATSLIPQCCNGRIGGRVIAPSCNFRYEINRFYYDTAAAPTTPPAPAPEPSTPPISQPPASPDESPPPAESPPPTSQPPASPDESPPPAASPPPPSQPPASPDNSPPPATPPSPNDDTPTPSSPLPQSPPPTPNNSANQKGKTSHFVLVLVPLLLSQYL